MSETNSNFIRQIIDEDLDSGKHEYVVTRFPPEPNGFLHIGHAKSICLNFGIGGDYADSHCNLRFDDTNPEKENETFVKAIQEDVRWLGFEWGEKPFFASDYFDRLYELAEALIEAGLAYVDDLSAEEIRAVRGSLTEAGKESPYRNRSVAENLDLFRRMRAGEFADGSKLLRAKIDMAHPNMNMRDPALYRIRRARHHNTGDRWCIYPMYDFTHPLSDSLEGVTHSLCTLEFEDHRPLYDWVLANSPLACKPRQIEFSRLNLQYTVTSKRKLTELVEKGYVDGWDDPRLPTISGMRRRGYPAAAIRDFCDRIGVTKSENSIEMNLLDACVREALDQSAPRRMAVLNPLKVVIENFEHDKEILRAPNHPKDESMGERELVLSREIVIDHADYLPEANKKFKRLVDGGAVRLRNGYVIQHLATEHDADGKPVLLRVKYFPESLQQNPEGLKVRGVIHWVSAEAGVPAEVRIYDPLFTAAEPGKESGDFHDDIAEQSLTCLENVLVEPAYVNGGPAFQFEREGYFTLDPDSTADRPVFNRTTTLRGV